MAYTSAQLAIVCPACQAVGKCLEKTVWGSKYLDYPHPERVYVAEREIKK